MVFFCLPINIYSIQAKIVGGIFTFFFDVGRRALRSKRKYPESVDRVSQLTGATLVKRATSLRSLALAPVGGRLFPPFWIFCLLFARAGGFEIVC